jgi:hypothetical protein
LAGLPAGNEAEVEARMRTDDGYFTPKIRDLRLEWK